MAPSKSSPRLCTTLVTLALLPLASALSQMTYVGCFSSSNGLSYNNGTFQYQSTGVCQELCVEQKGNQPVLGLTSGNDCWCGSLTPPSSAKVDDSKCNSPCTGYGQDDCGGDGFWSIYLTGTQSNVQSADDSSSSSGSSSGSSGSSPAAAASPPAAASPVTPPPSQTTAAPSVVTQIAPGKTVVVTESPQAANASASSTPSASSTSHSGGPSVAGIAAGVVIGVLAAAALVGGAIFFVRRRRRQQEDHESKPAQASSFGAGGGRPTIPAVNRTAKSPESRIDTEAMAQRRQSDGSIADNEDFSRKILTVRNPDERL